MRVELCNAAKSGNQRVVKSNVVLVTHRHSFGNFF